MTNHPLERISAYADGELTQEEERSVEAHLSVCTECSRELALIRALGGAMKASLAKPKEEPSAESDISPAGKGRKQKAS